MPNWTRNMLIVGSDKKMAELVKSHCPVDKESGLPEMDFNTIRKMPEDLSIEYGSRSHDGLRLLFTKLNPEVGYYGEEKDKLPPDAYLALQSEMSDHCWSDDLKPLSKEELERFKTKYKDGLPKVEQLGRQCVANAKKFGAMNWYEWCIQNWGTKWNATDTCVEGSEMTFDTAWDPAVPAIVELSRQHPEMPMALLFADEQTGARTGFVLMKGGKIDESGSFKDFSVDAYKLAFKCWGNEDEYKFDPKKNTYIRRDFETEIGEGER